MNKKNTGMLCYITWIGWLVAFLFGDRESAKFELNQGLVLAVASLIKRILEFLHFPGVLTGLLGLAIFACCVVGIYNAYKEQEKELPLVGAIKFLK